MNEMKFDVEPDGESGGQCDCCGSESRRVWGYVRHADAALAAYSVHWTVDGSLADHPANIDLIFGRWGQGTTSRDRSLVYIKQLENKDGRNLMVVDADQRVVPIEALAEIALKRSEVIGTPMAPKVFAMLDAVFVQDKRLP